MNVLVAANYATPASGNFISSMLELGLRLIEQGDSMIFIVPSNYNTQSEQSWVHWLEKNGFTVYLVDKEQEESASLAFLQQVIAKHHVDVLHLHFDMYHHLATHHAKELGVKIVIHDHMYLAAGSSQLKQFANYLAKSLIYRIKGISVISVNKYKSHAYFFARHWYIPNGLSMKRNVEHSATREECRSRLGFHDDEIVCLLLGWDPFIKGCDIAARAISSLRANKNIVLGIVGFGTPPNPKNKAWIGEKTGIDPDCGWIRYLPSTEDMFSYHRAADLYLSTSRTEAFPYGVLETISQNNPVVVSDIKGTKWCENYTKAFVYPVEDADACADAILNAIDAGERESNAEAVIAPYSIDRWCERMIDIYHTICF